MTVIPYSPSYQSKWDAYIDASKNGNFHLKRDFIEYHGDRFQDFSLMLVDEKDQILSLIPMNKVGDAAFSHQGLTYAGFVFSKEARLEENLVYMKRIIDYLIEHKVISMYYKTIPHIYPTMASEDDLCFLFLLDGVIKVRHLNPVINRFHKEPYQERRRRSIKKALKENISIVESTNYAEYWSLLSDLLSHYGAKPIHSLEEILQLQSKFPSSIKLYSAMSDSELLAGIVVFESEQVAKFQYIASSLRGKDAGALDLLTDRLIQEIYSTKAFIDFGTSTLDGGKKINLGISNQKEGFGARTTVHDHYQIDLRAVNWEKYNNFIA